MKHGLGESESVSEWGSGSEACARARFKVRRRPSVRVLGLRVSRFCEICGCPDTCSGRVLGLFQRNLRNEPISPSLIRCAREACEERGGKLPNEAKRPARGVARPSPAAGSSTVPVRAAFRGHRLAAGRRPNSQAWTPARREMRNEANFRNTKPGTAKGPESGRIRLNPTFECFLRN